MLCSVYPSSSSVPGPPYAAGGKTWFLHISKQRPGRFNLMSYPRDDLQEAIRSGRAVLILGAGVAAATCENASVGSWEALIKGARDYLHDEDDRDLLDFSLLSAKTATDMVRAAQVVRDKLGDAFPRWLNKQFSGAKVSNSTLVKAIEDLQLPILTTNYDKLVENILGRGTATWKSPDAMRAIIVDHTGEIGHLHGVYDDPDSLVFGSDTYAILGSTRPERQNASALFSHSRLIFIGAGSGIDDPDFAQLKASFDEAFPASSSTHFRLCRNDDVRKQSELEAITDVGYGDSHSDLPLFLLELALNTSDHREARELARVYENELLSSLLEASLFVSDSDEETRGAESLIVPPLFMLEPHAQLVSDHGGPHETALPVPSGELLGSDAPIILVAGEPGAGVSTAVTFLLLDAGKQDPSSVPALIDDPLNITSKTPLRSRLKRKFRGVDVGSLTLGIDNLKALRDPRYERVIQDIAELKTHATVIGVPQEDASQIELDLRKITANARRIRTVYLGRFSRSEAVEVARRFGASNPKMVADSVVSIIKRSNLPRTPSTIILVTRLFLSGTDLESRQTSHSVLELFIELLLDEGLPGLPDESNLTARQKRTLLGRVAARMVLSSRYSLPASEFREVLENTVSELDWTRANLEKLILFLTKRRLIVEASGTVSFARSAFLAHLAAAAALKDADLRSYLFEYPLRHSRVLKSMAAQARCDEELLEVANGLLNRAGPIPPPSRVFSPILPNAEIAGAHQADEDQSTAQGDIETQLTRERVEEEESPQSHHTHLVYDGHDDSDQELDIGDPELLLPASREALLVDLVSNVLQESDEIANQELKSQMLTEVLQRWADFLAVFESDIRSHLEPEIVEAAVRLGQENGHDLTENDVLETLTMVMPSYLTVSGIQSCLSAPSLLGRLEAIELPQTKRGMAAAMLRMVALLADDGDAWTSSMEMLPESAYKTFFSSVIISALLRSRFIKKPSLTKAEEVGIKSFVEKSLEARFTFSSSAERKQTLSRSLQTLEKRRLSYQTRLRETQRRESS